MKLGGVIYLQSIADKRMKSTTIRNHDMFHKICGDKALARVIIGTTNWGEVDENVGKMREKQLADNFWKTMIDMGSKVLRFDQTKGSALAFLDTILGQLDFGENGEITNDIALRIQEEIAELDRSIPETTAGQELRRTLKELLDLQKGRRNSENDSGDAAELSVSIEKQIEELRIPFTRKLFLKLFVSRSS
jgi:hypothetical protein